MRTRKSTLKIKYVVILFFCVFTQTIVCKPQNQGDTKKLAESLWEQAIAAKGGRERLYTINNMVVKLNGRYKINLFKTVSTYHESLYVFPNKLWRWLDDSQDDRFGLSIDTADLDLKVGWFFIKGFAPKPIATNELDEKDPFFRRFLDDVQYRYLLETKWVKPIPISTKQSLYKNKKVDIVNTLVRDKTVIFYLDQKNHLPVLVGDGILATTFSGYSEINGIQMPKIVNSGKVSFEFNVDYDETIFKRQPSIEAGPEAWRRSVNDDTQK